MRFLEPHPVLQRSDIMSQVKRAVVRSPVRMVGFSTETGSMAILRFGAAETGRPVHESHVAYRFTAATSEGWRKMKTRRS